MRNSNTGQVLLESAIILSLFIGIISIIFIKTIKLPGNISRSEITAEKSLFYQLDQVVNSNKMSVTIESRKKK